MSSNYKLHKIDGFYQRVVGHSNITPPMTVSDVGNNMPDFAF